MVARRIDHLVEASDLGVELIGDPLSGGGDAHQ